MLSLHVAKVNAGIGPAALVPGMHLPACVRSVEDHGFLLTTGIQVESRLPRLCNLLGQAGWGVPAVKRLLTRLMYTFGTLHCTGDFGIVCCGASSLGTEGDTRAPHQSRLHRDSFGNASPNESLFQFFPLFSSEAFRQVPALVSLKR